MSLFKFANTPDPEPTKQEEITRISNELNAELERNKDLISKCPHDTNNDGNCAVHVNCQTGELRVKTSYTRDKCEICNQPVAISDAEIVAVHGGYGYAHRACYDAMKAAEPSKPSYNFELGIAHRAGEVKTAVIPALANVPLPVAAPVQIQPSRKHKLFPSCIRVEPAAKDHTGTIVAMTCFRKYFYQIVLGYVTKEKSIFLPWGSAYHLFRQRLSEYYGYGDDEPRLFDKERADVAFGKAASEALAYWQKHGEEQSVDSKYDWFTSPRFLQSCKVAYEHWKLERQRGVIKVIAVEQVFNIQMKDGNFISGRADEIVRWRDAVWGRDFKTTSKDQHYFERGLTPNDQFTRYTWAEGKLSGAPVRGIIVQALYNAKSTKQGPKGPTIYEVPVERTPQEVSDWEDDIVTWHKMLDMCRETESYPLTPVNCSFCPYHAVCQKPTEAAREYHLRNYYLFKPWDPANIDDD